MVQLQAERTTTVLHTLPNGVRLLAIHIPHVQSASVGVFLRVGSRDETPVTNGIGHVLEHMAFKGTATRSVQAINLDAERLGADVNAFTGKDTTGYFMTGLGRHAEQLLRMTADIVLNSTFPDSELQRELEVIRQEAIEYEEDPQDSSSELLDRAIWGDDPMGMPVIGTVGNIEGFTRHDLVATCSPTTSRTNRRRCGRELRRRSLAGARRGALCSDAPSADLPVSRQPAPAKYIGHAMARRFTPGVAGVPEHCLPAGARAARGDAAAALAPCGFAGGQPVWRWDVGAPGRHRPGAARPGLHGAFHDGQRGRLGQLRGACGHYPGQAGALVTATGGLLRAQATTIDPVHLERAKNQLTVSRVRAAERTYATMEQAVEELFASGTVTPMAEAIAMIETISAEEVRAVFERMLANPPALAITGKGASARTARQLAARLAA